MSLIIKRSKGHRLRSRKDLGHKPNGHGIGKWHSRMTLWRYKRHARRLRKISAESRRRNRTHG